MADCKKGWGSLKDALRYREKLGDPLSKGKSGDPADSDTENVRDETEVQKSLESWPLWECMRFMSNQKSRR